MYNYTHKDKLVYFNENIKKYPRNLGELNLLLVYILFGEKMTTRTLYINLFECHWNTFLSLIDKNSVLLIIMILHVK